MGLLTALIYAEAQTTTTTSTSRTTLTHLGYSELVLPFSL